MRGIEVGRFYGNEVYGADGTYLGELKDDRLPIHQAKKSRRQISFRPERKKCRTEHRDQDGSVVLVGYEDFPKPDRFL
jgi:sporulation protein YlmC with PRC-barrel domain